MDDIKLRKIGDAKDNVLPRGVRAVCMDNRIVFVKYIAGRLMPLPQDQQEDLGKKCGLIHG
jgi:hypothetical protein